jgi:hypothetical protein
MIEQDCGGQQYSHRQTEISEKVFQRMQEQLNVCIRHHQDTRLCDHVKKTIYFKLQFLFQKEKNFT